MTGLARAEKLLRAGKLIGFPTETVYGLGADATNADAVAALFAAKGRPAFNPLICHVSDLLAAEKLALFDERARRLAMRFWPGPLTLVLPRRADGPVVELAVAGLATIAVRVPAHPVAQWLLRVFGRPVAAPSANPSGRLSPTSAQDVAEAMGDKIEFVLDAGRCSVGIESTIVGLVGGQAVLLRPGGIAQTTIEAEIGPLRAPNPGGDTGAISAPGMLASHYAPNLALRLDARAPSGREAFLAFGPDVPQGFAVMLNLSTGGNLNEAAANLFAYLRQLDKAAVDRIAVMPIPETGLGQAINDRLRRAAGPRE